MDIGAVFSAFRSLPLWGQAFAGGSGVLAGAILVAAIAIPCFSKFRSGIDQESGSAEASFDSSEVESEAGSNKAYSIPINRS